MKKKDYCTCFPEVWVGVDIHISCKLHDKTLSTHKFFISLKRRFDRKGKKGWLHASYITAGGAIGAWVKYTKTMRKRV